MDTDMTNLAQFVASELRAMMIPGVQLYKSGTMRGSVAVVAINEQYVDIVIATDYASYTNTRGRMAGWVERTVDRCCRCYSQNNNVESQYLSGVINYD